MLTEQQINELTSREKDVLNRNETHEDILFLLGRITDSRLSRKARHDDMRSSDCSEVLLRHKWTWKKLHEYEGVAVHTRGHERTYYGNTFTDAVDAAILGERGC